jgi:hypothetical protein
MGTYGCLMYRHQTGGKANKVISVLPWKPLCSGWQGGNNGRRENNMIAALPWKPLCCVWHKVNWPTQILLWTRTSAILDTNRRVSFTGTCASVCKWWSCLEGISVLWHITLCLKCVWNSPILTICEDIYIYICVYVCIYISKFLFASVLCMLCLPSYLPIYAAIHTSNDALNHPSIHLRNDPVFDLLIKSLFQLQYYKLTYKKKDHCMEIYPLRIKCSIWPPLRLATSLMRTVMLLTRRHISAVISLQAWMISAVNSIIVCGSFGKIFSLMKQDYSGAILPTCETIRKSVWDDTRVEIVLQKKKIGT